MKLGKKVTRIVSMCYLLLYFLTFRGHYSGRHHEEREKIGYQCKRVLDAGRLDYLEQHGFKASLVYYVDPTSTLENCALIALPQ